MHTIEDLYKALGLKLPHPAPAAMELAGITADSRQVKPGWVFVAEKGVAVDGHDFIGKAVDSGAAAVVCERLPEKPHGNVVWIKVADSVAALGELASWWYGYPSHKLTLVGITGTNGKTTIATLLYEMAREMGEKSGLISTVVNRIDLLSEPSTHTTPDPLTINRLLHQMAEAGCTFCAMEVSSHACAQRRIHALKFAGGVFTNLTRDHLDYHGTFDNYLRAKKSFFDSLPADAFALTNADDRNGAVMLQNCKARCADYSVRGAATFRSKVIESRIDGMTMTFDGTEMETPFVGRFNASNLTAVYAASMLIGWDREDVLRGLSKLLPVAGRMETIRSSDGRTAIVDYAHTPDALANVLATITDVAAGGAIITVTGAGGDRDKGKRPLMAAEAVKYSDMVVITSDNPRSESPADIAADMLAGVAPEQRGKVEVILDREEAIRHAIAMAGPTDVVLVAGKGHETYQIIGGETRHFDDREVVRQGFADIKP